MRYFAVRDSEKKYPLMLELRDFTQPWFFQFCLRWFNLSLPMLASLQSKLPEESSIETVLPVLANAKKEIELLPQSLHFLPDWLLFRPLNNWISQFFRVQKSELERSLATKITEATLKSPQVLQRDNKADETISQCIERHKKEIAAQPSVRYGKTYQQLKEERNESLGKSKHLREHRAWVVEKEGPKGEPIVIQFAEHTHVIYGTPSHQAQRDFERSRLARIDADIEREERNLSRINVERERFFLPAKYDNPAEYKELLDQRTQATLSPIKLYPNS
ncbi:hypothetical protein [Legionella sp.]|uniref:hypothetical protein n=1 Tax=Legionella sp. TaxID=459 RepID=UPI00321F739A